MLCVAAVYNPPLDSPYILFAIIIENFLSEVSKQLNVYMVKFNVNTAHRTQSGNLILISIDCNTLSSDDQRETSFWKPIANLNLGLLTDNDFLQRDVLLTDNQPKFRRSSCIFLSINI